MHTVKKISPLNYAFAIGKVRALEKFLIKQEVFEEAIESNLDEALRLFVESDLYGEELLHIKDSQQLEAVLNNALLTLRSLIKGLLLDKGLLDLLELNNLGCIENILKSYPSEFLQDYFMHLADMHNIKTFLRLYILKEPEELLKKHLICEGFIRKGVFLKLYAEDLAAFLNKLEYVHKYNRIIDYTYFLKEAIEKVEKENSFVALEKAINDFLIQVLLPAKYLSFGPEPLLAYYFAKVNEMNLMRMVILAKLNNIAGDLVKERLNNVYA
jgi:vacuolar-type H+-ATPase subunit C/Vma6